MALDIEREIGDVFEFDGRTFVVADALCHGCFFEDLDCMSSEHNYLGRCCDRQDGKHVIFKEVNYGNKR